MEGEKNPFVILDPDKNNFLIKGRSFPEHAEEFYKPVSDWLDDFLATEYKPFDFHFDLYYLNSASLVTIKSVLLKLKKQIDAGRKITIVWHYDPDDNDIKRTGEDYVLLTGVPLRFSENAEEEE